jgi:hypothetical protein
LPNQVQAERTKPAPGGQSPSPSFCKKTVLLVDYVSWFVLRVVLRVLRRIPSVLIMITARAVEIARLFAPKKISKWFLRENERVFRRFKSNS